MYAVMYGVYPYTGDVNISLAIQGNLVGLVSITGTGGNSVCNSCQGGIMIGNSNVYQTGWPGYAYGSTNQIKIGVAYSYYVSFVDLVIQYYNNNSTLDRTKVSIIH